MRQIIVIIILAAVVIGLAVYFNTKGPGIFSGPAEKIVLTRPRWPKPSERHSSNFSQPTSQSSQNINNQPSLPSKSKPSNQQATSTIWLPEIKDYQIPKGFVREQLSPYFQKITISSASRSQPGSVTLRSSSLKENINVTGWKISSNTGDIITPQAVPVYEPTFLSPEKDIELGASQSVVIYLTRSPMGKSLRLNKCTGYLNYLYKFEPALPRECHRVAKSEIATFSGQCQNYINSIDNCEIPPPNELNALSNECRAFISANFNHNACYNRLRNDPKFLSSEWRVWVGEQPKFLDPYHDWLWLVDKDGLLVDEYSY